MAKGASLSFDDCVKQCEQILAQMKSGHYAPLYLLHGGEGYFIDKIESYLTQNALSKDQKPFNQVVIYGRDGSGSQVLDAARRFPMLSDRQVVVVREGQSLSGLDDLVHYFASPMPTTILLIAYRGKSVDKRSLFYKKLVATPGAVLFESVAPRDYELGRFLGQMLTQRGLSAEPNVLQMIADNVGADLIRIDSELSKLSIRLGQIDRPISIADVEQNIGISKQFNNFELCRALSTRNFGSAMRIADSIAQNSKDKFLILTLPTLFNHFQKIMIVGFVRFEAKKQGRAVTDSELLAALKLTSPYFLREYKEAGAAYTLPKLVAIVGLLRQCDLRSKGVGGGSIDDGELLRDLILQIALA